MTPFASVAMLEKLALLKIAFCRAPAFKSTSSACLREVTSPAQSETSRVLVTSFNLAAVHTDLASPWYRSASSPTSRSPWAGLPPVPWLPASQTGARESEEHSGNYGRRILVQ